MARIPAFDDSYHDLDIDVAERSQQMSEFFTTSYYNRELVKTTRSSLSYHRSEVFRKNELVNLNFV